MFTRQETSQRRQFQFENKKGFVEINTVRTHNTQRVQEPPNTGARCSTRHFVQSGT